MLVNLQLDREIYKNCLVEAVDVDPNINKDVKHWNDAFCDGNKAAVPVMDNEVSGESFGRNVLDATRSIILVCNDDTLTMRDLFEDV